MLSALGSRVEAMHARMMEILMTEKYIFCVESQALGAMLSQGHWVAMTWVARKGRHQWHS